MAKYYRMIMGTEIDTTAIQATLKRNTEIPEGRGYLSALEDEVAVICCGVTSEGKFIWVSTRGLLNPEHNFRLERIVVEQGGKVEYIVTFEDGSIDIIDETDQEAYFFCVSLKDAIEKEMNGHSGEAVDIICEYG